MKKVSGSGTPRGAWCCPHCKRHRTKTLHGMNLHLYREHHGEGFGIYYTALELQAMKKKGRADVTA